MGLRLCACAGLAAVHSTDIKRNAIKTIKRKNLFLMKKNNPLTLIISFYFFNFSSRYLDSVSGLTLFAIRVGI